jgi:hypothetical protein
MIRLSAASAAFFILTLAACSREDEAHPVQGRAAAAPAEAGPAEARDAAIPPPAEAAAPASSGGVEPAAPGAPDYAALYPGAVMDQPGTTATGPHGDGGLVTFRTSASPDEVVAFYRERAEQAGLSSVMGMNQGAARAYGAAGGPAGATNIHVVAAPGEGGETSVQLSWSEGR